MQGSGRVVVSIIIQHARWPEFDEACWSPTATILGGQQGHARPRRGGRRAEAEILLRGEWTA